MYKCRPNNIKREIFAAEIPEELPLTPVPSLTIDWYSSFLTSEFQNARTTRGRISHGPSFQSLRPEGAIDTAEAARETPECHSPATSAAWLTSS